VASTSTRAEEKNDFARARRRERSGPCSRCTCAHARLRPHARTSIPAPAPLALEDGGSQGSGPLGDYLVSGKCRVRNLMSSCLGLSNLFSSSEMFVGTSKTFSPPIQHPLVSPLCWSTRGSSDAAPPRACAPASRACAHRGGEFPGRCERREQERDRVHAEGPPPIGRRSSAPRAADGGDLRPVHILRVRQLRISESRFPGNSLWTSECPQNQNSA